jgi:polysaccharide pyruvyl transferase WcaK-like protein
MIVCVHGIDFHNNGALMMLRAVIRFLDRTFPGTTVCVPFTNGDAGARARMGVSACLLTTRHLAGLLPLSGFTASRLARIVPREWLMRNGLIHADDVDMHIDASGFAYGDTWGARRTNRMVMLSRRWRQRKQPLVMLPQAYGSFEEPDVGRACRQYLSASELIFARDETSLGHLVRLGLPSERLHLAPDFTLDPALISDGWDAESELVAIVPNQRFLDTAGAGSDYVDLMKSCVRQVIALGLVPEVVLHEATDRRLAEEIAGAAGCRVVDEGSTSETSTLFARYRFVVASRYHALVAAMANGVPVVAIGWSHKYRGLMNDYGVATLSCDHTDSSLVLGRIRHVASNDVDIHNQLMTARKSLLEANEVMWTIVQQCIEGFIYKGTKIALSVNIEHSGT